MGALPARRVRAAGLHHRVSDQTDKSINRSRTALRTSIKDARPNAPAAASRYGLQARLLRSVKLPPFVFLACARCAAALPGALSRRTRSCPCVFHRGQFFIFRTGRGRVPATVTLPTARVRQVMLMATTHSRRSRPATLWLRGRRSIIRPSLASRRHLVLCAPTAKCLHWHNRSARIRSLGEHSAMTPSTRTRTRTCMLT
jgi:hypothetical protein